MEWSPLAEGRELKCWSSWSVCLDGVSPLAEGRELKLPSDAEDGGRAASPLAEGRELKYHRLSRPRWIACVAPRGGA